eukprot:gene3719-4239_t
MALRWQSLPACFLLVLASIHFVHSVVYVNQPGYYTYKQKQKTSQYNTFEIQFKTIDATGMLLYAKSVEKNDYLTIELIRGKIRYAAEFGNGVINIDKQITGYHQMYVGQDLADNQWHSVKVTQNVQDITIIIDGKREPKWYGFRRAPPAPTDFSVEEVFIGGLYSYVGVSEEESVSQEGTAACFRSATMNGIDLLQGTAARVNVLSYCPTVNYYPVFFPSRVSHMGVKDYISPRLKLKFDFRTVVSEQTVANYTNSFMKVLRLAVNREGRLVLGVTVENSGSHLVMKTAKQKFHDGKWHSVEFFISNNPPDYEAEFTVDGVKRRSKLKNKYIFDKGPLHFGHGFTGCMKNLVLNDRVVDYTKLQKVAVMLGKCNLKDYCTPNPCINGGKCNQTDTNFRCDCRHTPYTGSCCNQGEVFEKVLYLEEHSGHNGFRLGRSFLSQLLQHHDNVLQALEEGKNVDVVYLDFSKAFDKVDFNVNLRNLEKLGKICGKIGRWICSFLTDRHQTVLVDGVASTPAPVKSGVLQGSVQGPVLFLVLIGDIDENFTQSFVSSFADDTRVGHSIASGNDVAALQQDVNAIYRWSNKNNRSFNTEKFELVQYGRNDEMKKSSYFTQDCFQMKHKSVVNDLGVMLSNSGGKAGEIQELESVQRSFVRRIKGLENLDYWERGRMLRRTQTLRESSFAVRGPQIFNSLPAEIRAVSHCSVTVFKTVLDACLKTILDEPLVLGYTARREIHEKIGDRFQSDKYWLDMDGVGGLPPIRAFCRKGNRVIDTITQINTTIPYDINVINPTGKKIIPVTYLADEESIRELLLHHSGCRQFIRYRCERSALFKSPIGPKMVQWMGFDDKLHYYWGGSGGRRGYCACGITRTCRNPYQTCNCDSYNRNLHVEDRGYLTIKEHLPVRRIDYFDVQSDSGKTGLSTIGPLQCWGDGGKYLAVTFRQPYSFLQIALTDENDWNNYIDAGDVAFEFLTTRAAGTMVFAKGPFSGDFLDIRLIGRTRARATMNLGYYKNLHLDVDISSKQRTFDDNKPHKLRLDWNRREMNFTVDNITRIVEFHYQYGVTHLDIDGTPFYVGGRNDGLGEGFMGCIRSFYYGGKLVDLPLETDGLSSIGVYPGQGAICKLVKSPCNQGFCIDEYSHYKCNCSVSAFSGAHCQLNELGFTFLSGDWIEHTFQNPVDVQEGYINVAFNTSLSDALIFQMRGKDNAHMTLMLQNGALKLSFNFVSGNLDKQLLITLRHPKPLGKFNDKLGHIVRVHHKENQIFAHVLDDVNVPINYTLNISAPYTLMPFPAPQKLSIGKRDTTIMSLALPQVFEGCVTGLKYHYLPVNARVGVTVDILRLYNASLTTSSLWTKGSNRAPRKGSCGWELPVPPSLPTIVPPPQFRFRNPVVTVAPIGSSYSFSKVAIVIVICVLAIAAVILLFFTIRCVEKKNKHFKGKVKKLERDYHAQGIGRSKSEQTAPLVRNERQQKQPVSVSSDERQFTTGYQPAAASYQPAAASYQPAAPSYQPAATSYQPANSGYQRGGTSYETKAPVSSSAARQPAAVAASPKDEEEDGDWFL